MISKTGVHVVRALILIAGLPPGAFAGARVLAERSGAPANYLGKLLRALSLRGVLESRKGMGGGFRLARPPASIALLEVLDPIEGFSNLDSCVLGRPECSSENPCVIHERWAAIRDDYIAMLRDTSLEDVIRQSSRGLEIEGGADEASCP